MSTWTNDELSRIGQADELRITPLRADGSPGRETTVQVVRDGADLYVRAYRGRDGAWFRAATARHEGRVGSGGMTGDVALAEADEPTPADRLDTAYRTRHGHYSATYVDPMLTEGARNATLKLLPH
jgi:hypothetical protein